MPCTFDASEPGGKDDGTTWFGRLFLIVDLRLHDRHLRSPREGAPPARSLLLRACPPLAHRGKTLNRGRPHEGCAYALRAPTGQYDLPGNAIFTDGDLLIDSVHRFKGRASPCVVFTEIDFEQLDDAAVRRMFVGATRATMELLLVVSEKSARVLMQRISAE